MSARGLLEALLFVSGEATAVSDLSRWMELPPEEVLALAAQEEDKDSGLVIRRLDDSLQLATSPVYAEKLQEVFSTGNTGRLSDSLLETLTIIAYQQPVTRQEIDDIRGVNSSYAVSALRERGLIEKAGTKDVLGHPALYRTTDAFLRQFDLASLKDLPPLPAQETQRS